MANVEALVVWARRLQSSSPGSQAFRRTLEATLLPMVRCALRTGLGQPPLVSWVQTHLPTLEREVGPKADPTLHTGPMTDRLCEWLLAGLEPVSERETVVGA